jgi:ABC-type Fe3+ transport system substrate-binding protein
VSARRLPMIAALALTVVLAGCGSGAGGDNARSIVLYNGQHPQLTNELVTAFEKQTGISVRVRTNDGIVLADQLLQEGRSSPADVYLTENSPALSTLDQRGLLAKLPAATLEQVAGKDEPPSGNWAPVARRISGLAYDPSQVSEANAFVDFLVSAAGQQILARSDDFEYPVRPGVAPNPVLPPLSSISPATLGAVALGNDQAAAKLIQQSGLG